ncbi:MAG: hypothetical protein COV74_09010 [Candidatus Omnitrophica bacterium CG11_big_fil_rev_8_21_14_0_20_45_26]|uniref:Polysaccharide pyruvyl transferase domain-containing protein n=1 Tax=Candidatus Abzuiibacterium crystallinum TaxID=1974748 RepID=A0A2H0LLR8_9BACT|nr:MAG: hypothetical protein COV74_09010 [Candidatus Omnitrophica bacterium CG11_big_fil_rev_8_21_14_0_20_45_26]PIW64352.1 MAG: hypothetical protein COW12_06855 [Candidatus Omnitrophica bacterium CG12_big_fil_rev_8_21_14_0_65_45_16]
MFGNLKVFFANDTSSEHHAGCIAVSFAHRAMLRKKRVNVIGTHYVHEAADMYAENAEKSIEKVLASHWGKLIRRCDALVVNGEGTIHHGKGMHLLAMIAAAQKLNKKTFLINCVLQEVPPFINIFSRLTDLTVREPFSAAVAKRLGGKPRIVPDSILEAPFQDKIYENLRNEIVIGDGHEHQSDVCNILESLRRHHRTWRVKEKNRQHDWMFAIASLRTARLYVTGRFHGIYLCALAGIPFVALPSNSHKIEALIAWSKCRIPICYNLAETEKAIKYALNSPNEFDKFRTFLLTQKPLTTFEYLN